MPSLIMQKFCKKCGECKCVFPVVIVHVVEVKACFSAIIDCDSSVELCDQCIRMTNCNRPLKIIRCCKYRRMILLYDWLSCGTREAIFKFWLSTLVNLFTSFACFKNRKHVSEAISSYK